MDGGVGPGTLQSRGRGDRLKWMGTDKTCGGEAATKKQAKVSWEGSLVVSGGLREAFRESGQSLFNPEQCITDTRQGQSPAAAHAAKTLGRLVECAAPLHVLCLLLLSFFGWLFSLLFLSSHSCCRMPSL